MNEQTSKTQRRWAGDSAAAVVLILLAALPSLYHGVTRDAFANADMDILSIYQALTILAGQPLEPNAHTGYLYFMALAGWLQAAEWMQVVASVDLGELTAVADFDRRFGEIVFAARWFSIALAGGFAVLVYAGCVRLSGSRAIAFALGVLFTLGDSGLASQSVMLRTELPSMVLVFAASLLLVAAVKASPGRAIVCLAIAGLLVHFALMVKIQVVVLVMFLPAMAVIFGWDDRNRAAPPVHRSVVRAVVLGFLIAAVMSAVFVLPNLIEASSGVVPLLVLAYIGASAVIFGALYRGSAVTGMLGFAAVGAGYMAAYAVNAVFADPVTHCVVFNFVDYLLGFTTGSSTGQAPQLPVETMTKAAASGAAPTSTPPAQSEFVRFVSERVSNLDYPFMIIFAAVAVGIFWLLATKRYVSAVKAGFLMAMAVMIIATFWVARGTFSFYYSIYVEAWVILAVAIVCRELASASDAGNRPWVRLWPAVPLVLLAAVVAGNVTFRLSDPQAANTRPPQSLCIVRWLAPGIERKFDARCEDLGFSSAQSIRAAEARRARSAAESLKLGIPREYVDFKIFNTSPSISRCVAHWVRPD